MGLFIAFKKAKELGEEKYANNIYIKWQEIACLWSSFQSGGLDYWVFVLHSTRYAGEVTGAGVKNSIRKRYVENSH